MIDLPLVPQSLDFSCGAACFECLMLFFKKNSLGELFYAQKLGTLDLGYTEPEKVVEFARENGFSAILKDSASPEDLHYFFAQKKVIFVTWWDEDAGHYSLIRSLDAETIELMDPWTAREGKFNCLKLRFFLPLWQQRGARFIAVSP